MDKFNNINEENFDNSIRQHLADAPLEPSPELWERIEASLDAETVATPLGWVRWAMTAVAVAAVFAVGSVLWLQLDHRAEVLPSELLATLDEPTKSTIVEPAEVTETEVEVKTITLAENKPAQHLTKKSITAHQEPKTAEVTKEVIEKITEEPAKKTKATPKQPQKEAPATNAQRNITKYYNPTSEVKRPNRSKIELSLMTTGSTLSSASNSISSIASSQDLATAEYSAPPQDVIGSNNGDSGVGDSGNEDIITQPDYSSNKNTQEIFKHSSNNNIEHEVPVTFALSAAYKFSEKWSLESGLSYSYLASTITTPYSNSSIRQQVEFVGVPLRMNYQILSTPKFSLYAGAGTQIERCVNAKVNSKSVSEKDWHWSLDGIVGAQYHVNNWLGIYAEPEVSYYLTETNLTTIRTEHPLSCNIRFGLRFSFGASR